MREGFSRFARATAWAMGTPAAFVGSLLVVLVWALLGPLFHFSQEWQLVINSATTIVTFWMVFVIQASQNTNDRATQVKLDGLIHALDGVSDRLVGLEKRTEAEIAEAEQRIEGAAGTPGDAPTGG